MPFGGRGLISVVGVALGSTGFRSHAASIPAITRIQRYLVIALETSPVPPCTVKTSVQRHVFRIARNSRCGLPHFADCPAYRCSLLGELYEGSRSPRTASRSIYTS